MTPYIDASGATREEIPPVWNSVVELSTGLTPETLLEELRTLERQAGRTRALAHERSLDLDLLAQGRMTRETPTLRLPHPRATSRAFVLEPWAEIAPRFVLTGPGGEAAPVATWAARWLADYGPAPEQIQDPLPFASRAHAPVTRLHDLEALRAWRVQRQGSVALVPTMGALHAGQH